MNVITLDNLTRFANKLKSYFVQIKDSVRSVNGNFPDANGDISVSRVDWAAELESESTQWSEEAFIVRTAGGDASIETGDAWLMGVYGNSIKTGYVPEQINMTVTPIPREPGVSSITAVLNRDTFVAYVPSSTTITLTYTTVWSADPTLYGITVVGTPIAGDQITVVYVKLELGTITNADPTEFVATGWNLFDSTNEYARVVNYGGNYRIDGAYTALKFAATPTGTQTNLTVSNNIISGFPEGWTDGYILVTGGNNTTTAIYPTWSDWADGYAQHTPFAVFSKFTIDLSIIMNGDGNDVAGLFPYGLIAIGVTNDEINFNSAQAISRIERKANTAENLAEVIASGRPYDYDTNNIYVVRETPVVTYLTGSYAVGGSYTANDHGMEWFEGTTIEVPAQNSYGASLKNKIERDTVTISQQTLTATQQQQIKTNLGIVYSATQPSNPVTGMIWLKPEA